MLLRLCLKPARWKLSDFVGLLVDDFVSIEIKKNCLDYFKKKKEFGGVVKCLEAHPTDTT